jgi:hypothetical protein
MVKKRAAMELSMSTIVILVLAMMMLIMGIVLVKNIFSTSNEAINDLSKGVKDSIAKMFADETKKLVIYPSSRSVEIKKRSQGSGFAFSVRNLDFQDQKYSYKVEVDQGFEITKKCGGLTKKEADNWLDIGKGQFSIPKSSIMEEPILITFTVPDSAPACTIPYVVTIYLGTGSALYVSDRVAVVIKAR